MKDPILNPNLHRVCPCWPNLAPRLPGHWFQVGPRLPPPSLWLCWSARSSQGGSGTVSVVQRNWSLSGSSTCRSRSATNMHLCPCLSDASRSKQLTSVYKMSSFKNEFFRSTSLQIRRHRTGRPLCPAKTPMPAATCYRRCPSPTTPSPVLPDPFLQALPT